MGNFIGSAVFPVAFALTWKRCSALGAIAGCWCGLGLSMLAWCLAAQTSKLGKGLVNVDTLGDDLPSLAGNLVALFSSPIICVIISLMAPQKDFEWDQLKKTTEGWLVEDDIDEAERVTHSELIGMNHGQEDSEEELNRVLFFSYWFGGGLSIVLIIIWPLLTLPEVTFSKGYWSWWVAIGFLWAHGAAIITMVYPIWEIRAEIHAFITGKKPEEPAPPAKTETSDLVMQAKSDPLAQARPPSPLQLNTSRDVEFSRKRLLRGPRCRCLALAPDSARSPESDHASCVDRLRTTRPSSSCPPPPASRRRRSYSSARPSGTCHRTLRWSPAARAGRGRRALPRRPRCIYTVARPGSAELSPKQREHSVRRWTEN
jgi:hypothetical protein